MYIMFVIWLVECAVFYAMVNSKGEKDTIEHTPDYEIAFQAGVDKGYEDAMLATNEVVREAYRWYRSVTILKLSLDDCIQGYTDGYAAYLNGIV